MPKINSRNMHIVGSGKQRRVTGGGNRSPLWLLSTAWGRFTGKSQPAQAGAPRAGKARAATQINPPASPNTLFRARQGEDRQSYFRSDRMFTVGHSWYSATREGVDMGPYRDRGEAETALALFVARKGPGWTREQTARHADLGELNNFEVMVAEFSEFLQLRQENTPARATAWVYGRLQLLRERKASEQHQAARAAALEYLLERSDQHL